MSAFDRMNTSVLNRLGVDMTLDDGSTIRVLFKRRGDPANFNAGGVQANTPMFKARLSDIGAAGLIPKSCVTIQGEYFTVVSNPEPDDSGMGLVMLRKVNE